MQQFIDMRPELTEMSASALELWIAGLQALLKQNEWSPPAQELMAFCFGGELLSSSCSPEGSAPSSPIGPPPLGKGGLAEVVAAAKAAVTEDGELLDLDMPSKASAPDEKAKLDNGFGYDGPAKTGLHAPRASMRPPRLPYLAARELGLTAEALGDLESRLACARSLRAGDGWRFGTDAKQMSTSTMGAAMDDALDQFRAQQAAKAEAAKANGAAEAEAPLGMTVEAAALKVHKATAVAKAVENGTPPMPPPPPPQRAAVAAKNAVAEAAAVGEGGSQRNLERNLDEAFRDADGDAESADDGAKDSGLDSDGDTDDSNPDPRRGGMSTGGEWLSPADGWTVEYEEPILWELHFWAKGYDRTQLEYNACVIEQLHKMARTSHEQIVARTASEYLERLDKLQAKTLHGKPFGHRCARSISLSTKSDADEDEEDEAGKDDSSGDDEATDKGAG
jgi:hypothetical protein